MMYYLPVIELSFLISSFRLSVAGSGEESSFRQPLVTFGELSEVVLDRYTLRSVESIEEDLLNPGGFIVGDQHSVAVIAPNLTVQLLAGDQNETAFQNGIGSQVYFSTVRHVTQYRDGADIIVADYGNHCIRIVNRATARVSTFAGQCRISGYLEDISEVSAFQAQFMHPVASLYVKQQNIFYYLLEKPAGAIIRHNLTRNKVSLVYHDLSSFKFPFAMISDTYNKYLYVNHDGGISRFNTENWERTIVAGTNSSSSKPDGITTSKDGTLSTARFHYMAGMAWLIRDQVLIVNQHVDHSMRVVDFVDDRVSTLCEGQDLITRRFTTGDLNTCKMNEPISITVVNGSVYIGEESGTSTGSNTRRGHIVKLTYYQPLCTPPEINSNYSLLQEIYTHNQTVRFRCDEGSGISTPFGSIQCVRELQNNTVVGKWNRDLSNCQDNSSLIRESTTKSGCPAAMPSHIVILASVLGYLLPIFTQCHLS